MNQLEDQKGLVEYLEAALEEAKKRSPSDVVQTLEIERELREARSEYQRLSDMTSPKPDQPALVEVDRSAPRRPEALRQPELVLNFELEPRYRTFINNFKSLFSHETKIYTITAHPIETDLIVEPAPWYRTVWDNLKSLVSPNQKSYSNITSKPIATDLLIEGKPWYVEIFSQLKYLFVKEEQPELQITAQPVEVDEVFKEYKFQSSSVLLSALVHVAMIAAMLFLPLLFMGDTKKVKQTETQISLLDASKLLLNMPPNAEKSGGGGGGGRREKTPASLGKLPRPADRQLTPPVPKVVNPAPVLPVEPTVVVPQLAQLPKLNFPDYGDPTGIPGPPSSGPGTGGGIGTGSGGGVGPGKGGGVGPGEGGGTGGGLFRVGGGVSAPTVIYKVDPTYSEEARKAKYQGTVVLSAIVRKDGTIEILKVVRGLGLGLDENAIQALRQWKFRPGMRNGAPVDVALNIEVNFTLR